MNKRILVPLALLVAAALTLAACGGGSSDEDQITKAIETATTTSDPSNCTAVQTQRYVEQSTTEKGKAALKTCEKEAEADETTSESVNVGNISTDGDKATAEGEFEGGALDSQAVEFALVEEDGEWKLDYVEGFAKYNGKAFGKAFQTRFEELGELDSAQSECIGDKIAALSKAEAESVVFGGSAEPIIELAQSCASA